MKMVDAAMHFVSLYVRCNWSGRLKMIIAASVILNLQFRTVILYLEKDEMTCSIDSKKERKP